MTHKFSNIIPEYLAQDDFKPCTNLTHEERDVVDEGAILRPRMHVLSKTPTFYIPSSRYFALNTCIAHYVIKTAVHVEWICKHHLTTTWIRRVKNERQKLAKIRCTNSKNTFPNSSNLIEWQVMSNQSIPPCFHECKDAQSN